MIRTARKTLPCDYCDQMIAAGSQYNERYIGARAHIGCEKPIKPTPKFLRMTPDVNGKRTHCRLYRIWDGMQKRCYLRTRADFHCYGGKGIRVCPEWRRNYPAFRAWAIANGYRKELTLDRIDSARDYEASNCRWATREEQTYNTPSVIKLTLDGVTKLLPIWAKELGFTPDLLRARRSSGWTDEQVLTIPKGGSRPGVLRGRAAHKARSLQ